MSAALPLQRFNRDWLDKEFTHFFQDMDKAMCALDEYQFGDLVGDSLETNYNVRWVQGVWEPNKLYAKW